MFSSPGTSGVTGPSTTPVAQARRRSTWLRLCAAAGIVGPLLFTATFLVQEQFRRDEYSPIAEPVSALEAGPNGWIQQLNFVVFAVLLFAFAVGLHHGVQSTRFGFAGPAIIAWGGVGLVLAAVFPLREDVTGATYNPTGLHYMSGPIVFSSIGVGLVVLSRRLARDPSWRSLADYTLGTGIALVVMFVVFGLLVRPDEAPLHDYLGLAQRATLAVWFPCLIVLAARLLRLTRDPQRLRRRRFGMKALS
jgi:hypothetical membrane protein